MSTQTINLGQGRSIVFTDVTPQRIAGRALTDTGIPFGAQVRYLGGSVNYTKVGMPDGNVGYMAHGRCYADSAVGYNAWYLATDIGTDNNPRFVNGTGSNQVRRRDLAPGAVFINPKGATMLRRRASDKSPINTILATTGITEGDCDADDQVTLLGHIEFVKP